MAITAALLREAGYPVSQLKDENTITLAESDIKAAYFPADETFESTEANALLYALTYSLLLKRKIQATRYGSVAKVSQYSIAAEEAQIKSEIRNYCKWKLEKFYAESTFDFQDILEIYDNIIFV